ncbi:NAD(P)/FAD-dependent oxidoreductase [Parafrankia sp. EUN1f]|uniref:phytoene desaturase family protein n=1 Tax=Parafrankia sp. EUN1f TaxID=102897 RepID=UPI0001C477FB|nr:NAD(P)/FAD-dependent oxidoreductase [Parafrankia sp. EUN1f]EFC79612.1 FAD dependent oxidoreductase [Parafrankia sp. EUN1f]
MGTGDTAGAPAARRQWQGRSRRAAGAGADAVVIGAGVNGLVAANLLVDAGWDVVVCEAQAEPGGACRSARLTVPGVDGPSSTDLSFGIDLFSAFHPFAAASPVLRGLALGEHGLRWRHAPTVLAHPLPDGRCAQLSTDLGETCASLADFAPGDADAWQEQVALWRRVRAPLLDALLATPFPPVRAGARLLRALGAADALRFARFGVLPVRRFAAEEFAGDGAGLLLAGCALHTDLAPEAAGSALIGWLLAMLGQDVGFPVPEGGAGNLAAALVRRLRARGGELRTGTGVDAVTVRAGRADGVRLADGTVLPARRAVIADVDAVSLYRRLVAPEHLPPRLFADLDRFHWDSATFKVNWALAGPIPWSDPRVARAGTVHLGGTMDDLTVLAAELARDLVPAQPFVVLGQMTTADPSRSPAGTESAWAYFHLPQRPRGHAGTAGARLPATGAVTGRPDEHDVAVLLERLERRIEAYAPGFTALVLGRDVQSPARLESMDRVLHGGALGGGTAALHQQLVFRPVPGLGRPETPVPGLYLASMSAHPGGGVHGGPGAMAARVALGAAGPTGAARRRALAATHRMLYSMPARSAEPG